MHPPPDAKARGRRTGTSLVAGAMFWTLACTVPNAKIEGEDDSPLLGSARVSVDLKGHPERISREPPRNDFHLLIDFELSSGYGEFNQQVVPPDVISVGGPQFTGNVEVEFELERFVAAVRAANRFPSGIGIDAFAGICASDLDIQLSQTFQSDLADYDGLGPLIGAKFSLRPLQWFELFIEGSFALGTSSDVETVTIQTFDAGGQFIFGRHGGIIAGWRRIDYDAEVDDFQASDLELVLTGPVVTLVFGF